MDSDANEDLDETLPSSQDGDIVHRSESLQHYINTGFFDVLIEPGKRTLKNKSLMEEMFTFGVYLVKQCGFLTSRPLFWLKKLDEYVSTSENISGIFRYKKIKSSGKCLSALIDICYQTTRKISLVIGFQTGVVMVKGEHYEHWIRTESHNLLPSLLETTSDGNTDDNGKEKEDEVTKQLNSLWNENDANKSSIENIDETVRSLRTEISNYFTSHESAVLDVANIYDEIKKIDSRTTTFMETTTDTCKNEIKLHLTKINKKLDVMSNKFTELKNSVNQRIDKFIQEYNSVNENVIRTQELTLELEHQKKEIKDVIDGYKTFHQSTEEESTPSRNASKRKISAISNEVDKQNIVVSEMERELHKLKNDNVQFKQEIRNICTERNALSDDALNEFESEIDEKLKKMEERLANQPPNRIDATEQKITKMVEEAAQSRRSTKPRTPSKQIDVVFCMDSNSKFIRFKKFWTIKNTLRRRIYTQTQLKTFIENLEAESITTFLIHVGVNDIDRKTGQEVFHEVKGNVALLKAKYPQVKVVVAELTPRKDAKDREVNECNKLINDWAPGEENIFVASHATLRENKERILHDNKHITKKLVGMFVVNLKKALCQATGVQYLGRAGYRNLREGSPE